MKSKVIRRAETVMKKKVSAQNPSSVYDGEISEIRFFKRALTKKEIEKLYREGSFADRLISLFNRALF